MPKNPAGGGKTIGSPGWTRPKKIAVVGAIVAAVGAILLIVGGAAGIGVLPWAGGAFLGFAIFLWIMAIIVDVKSRKSGDAGKNRGSK